MYKKRKGFTIVELVIVIAVIAVLAAVLIPTFTNLVDKANQSADIQATQQMNVALAAGSIPDAPQTPVEMIEILADAGFNSETCLIPVTKGFRFYWTGPEYNTIVLAQVPDELLNDEPQAQTFALARNVTAESLGIKVICPAEDEEFVAAIEEALLALYNHIKNKDPLPEGFALFDLADGAEYLKAIVSGEGVVPVTGVTLDSDTLSLAPGGTAALSATVAPENATMQDVRWSSDNTAVATVDQNGNITAGEPGTATITVTTVEGNFTATCVVTVNIPVTGITFDRTELTIKPGETATLTVTISPNNASNQKVTWSTSNSNVASSSDYDWFFGGNTVEVTAGASGTATITATAKDGSGVKATCTITVVSPAERLEADLTSGQGATLTESLTVNVIEIPAGVDTTLDLGNQTLTCTEIVINDGSTLTIRNGTLSVEDQIWVETGGTLEVDHVTATTSTGNMPCIKNFGTATINNSEFETTATYSARLLVNYGTMTVDTCKFTSKAMTFSLSDFVIYNTADKNCNPNGAHLTLTNVTVDAKYGGVIATVNAGSEGLASSVIINGGSYTTSEASANNCAINAGGNSCTVTLKDGVKIFVNDTEYATRDTVTGTEGTDYTISTIS